jgi:hypothetical protein
VSGGQFEDFGNDRDGQLSREIGDQVGMGFAGDLIDQFPGHLGDPAAEHINGARGKAVSHQLSIAGVIGWVHRYHGGRLDWIRHARVGPGDQRPQRSRQFHLCLRRNTEPFVSQYFSADAMIDAHPREGCTH